MALTPQQQKKVEQNLGLVHKVICCYITTHNDITGMEYDDLYQTGCLALCDAVQSYCPKRDVSFTTYANIVIRNRLYDYCRHINHIQSRLLYLDSSIVDDGETSHLDYIASDPPTEFASGHLITLLLSLKKEYSGITAKGVEALLLKANGYTGKEIAQIYCVKPNHISAWISRANSKLRQDPRILAAV